MPKERIELDLPADDDTLVVVRLTVGAVATRAGFDVDDVEDLQLAAAELCASVVRCLGGAVGRLRVETRWEEGSFEMRCTGGPPPGGRLELAADFVLDETAMELSARILDALVDEHGNGDDGRQAWFVKRRQGVDA